MDKREKYGEEKKKGFRIQGSGANKTSTLLNCGREQVIAGNYGHYCLLQFFFIFYKRLIFNCMGSEGCILVFVLNSSKQLSYPIREDNGLAISETPFIKPPPFQLRASTH